MQRIIYCIIIERYTASSSLSPPTKSKMLLLFLPLLFITTTHGAFITEYFNSSQSGNEKAVRNGLLFSSPTPSMSPTFPSYIDTHSSSRLKDVFAVPVTANSHVIQSSVSNVIFNSAFAGYCSAVDSLTMDIAGLWNFDVYNRTSFLSPDSSHGLSANGPQLAKGLRAGFLPSGGRYGGGFSFNRSLLSYISIPNGPMLQAEPLTTGFSMAVWVYPFSVTFLSQRIWERQYDNMDLFITSSGFYCQMGFTSNKYFQANYNWRSNSSSFLKHWTNVGCSYKSKTNALTIWINGSAATTTIVPSIDVGGGFRHSDYTTITLGGRTTPFGSVSDSFSGILDEFVIWNRPLSANEWLILAGKKSNLIPYYGPLSIKNVSYTGFVSTNYINLARFDVAAVSWDEISFGVKGIQVYLSTDNGAHYCRAYNRQDVSNYTQGGNITCRFPSTSIKYKVVYSAAACLLSLNITFKASMAQPTLRPTTTLSRAPSIKPASARPSLVPTSIPTVYSTTGMPTVIPTINMQQSTGHLLEVFNVDISSNSHINQASVTTMRYNRTLSAYCNAIDPSKVSTYTLNVIGMWNFDTYSNKTHLSPDSSAGNLKNGGPQSIQNTRAAYLPKGGKHLGGFHFDRSRMSYLAVANGPMEQNLPLTTGYSMAVWIFAHSISYESQRVWERMFDNIDLNIFSWGIQCSCRYSTGQSYEASMSWGSKGVHFVRSWTHVGCSFDPLNGMLSMWINGSLISSASTPTSSIGNGFSHADFMTTTLGGRNEPYTSASEGFAGILDEFAIWRRPLTAGEWNSIAKLTAPWTPFPGIGFSSNLFVNLAIYDSISATWVTSNNSPAIEVSISTDGGVTFCRLNPGETLSMVSQGKLPVCLFPANSLLYKVLMTSNTCLTSITFTFGSGTEWDDSLIVPIGLNSGDTSYYSSAWVYKDVLRWSGFIQFPENVERASDGYPLALSSTSTESVWKLAVTNLISGYPEGTYTLLSEGMGTIMLQLTGANYYLTVTGNYSFGFDLSAYQLSQGGIIVRITSSSATDHVRNLRIIMPGFADTYKLNPFHPAYLNDSAGFAPIRTMDMSNTNGNNIARWADRARPFTAYENAESVTTFPIQSITWYEEGSLFSGKFTALVTVDLAAAKGQATAISTGQIVDIIGTNSYVRYLTDSGVAETQSLNLAAWQTNIEVLTANSFLVAFSQYYWNSNYVVTHFEVGLSQGYVQLTIRPGAALETIIQYVNLHKGGWFNIPTAADDDYVLHYATMLRDQLHPNATAYIEYSNECWNWIFHSSGYTISKSKQLQLNSQADFVALRSIQIFKIFEDVFGAAEMKRRIVKVLPSFAANQGYTQQLLEATRNRTINPFGILPDVVCIAPYFGASILPTLYEKGLIGKVSIDFVVDSVRLSVETDVRLSVRSTVALAKQYGMTVVAYEIGQHLVSNGINYADNAGTDAMTRLLIEVNRDQRMEGIYDNMIRVWAQEGGTVMCAFAATASYSKYGAWGFKEYQMQPFAETPKYRSLRRAVQRYVKTGITSSSPSRSPSKMNTNMPSSAPSLKSTSFPVRSISPTLKPSCRPTTSNPTAVPSIVPSRTVPTVRPSTLLPVAAVRPSVFPSSPPSNALTVKPTTLPPTARPTIFSSSKPKSNVPTAKPTGSLPTTVPSSDPKRTTTPTSNLSRAPTTIAPSARPSLKPSSNRPTVKPSALPTSGRPTIVPSLEPSRTTTIPTRKPSGRPSVVPSRQPTSTAPTVKPTTVPSAKLSHIPTPKPSALPTSSRPTTVPSAMPSRTSKPTLKPSGVPTTIRPSTVPSRKPSSNAPTTFKPTTRPTSSRPTIRTNSPTRKPSRAPTTIRPSTVPSRKPSSKG